MALLTASKSGTTDLQQTSPAVRLASSAFLRGVTRVVLSLVAVAALTAPTDAKAQALPQALPQTATLLAGGANPTGSGVSGVVLPASGAVCYTGSLLKATDAYGDGCPGPYTTWSADFRGGVVADGAGNVFVIENTENLIRRIDAKSGIVTAVTGTAITGCTTNSDGYGDGCPFAQTKVSGPRGGGVDPYGNVIIAGYNMHTVNILCNAVSPLCPNTPGHKQVGSMYRLAGCVASATATGTAVLGTTAGTAGDGQVASPNGNLSGDIADWGAGNTAYTTTCSTSVGGVDGARGATADKYGNVYIADTTNLRFRVVVGPPSFTLPNGTVLNNPIYNAIKIDPIYSSITAASAYGHIYPLMGAFSSSTNGGTAIPTTAGTACGGTLGGATLDTVGDGCPFYESTNGTSTSSTIGIGTDADGNAIIPDQNNKLVRVFYIGGSTMASAIQKANNNPSLAVTPGYIYSIVGLGGITNPGISYTPTLGTATAINSNGSRIAVGPGGNLYFGDYGKNSIYMFDIATGYARNVLVTGTACSTTAPNHDSVGDGCSGTVFGTTLPTTSPFAFGSASDAMSITFDPQGNLIVADITNALIRKIMATDLAPVRLGTPNTQTITIHAPAGSTGISAALVGTAPTYSEIYLGSIACAGAANADGTLDCQIPVSFAPTAVGRRSALLSVTAQGPNTTVTFPISGTAIGSALVADTTSAGASPIGSVTNATSIAADGSGNVFTTDSNVFKQFNAATGMTTLAGTPPTATLQIAVDNLQNLYAVNGSSTIVKDTLGAAGTYTSASVAFTMPAATYGASPAALNSAVTIYGVAADTLGNVFFSDRTNQAVFEIPAGQFFESQNEVVPVVTGFNNVGDLALDGAGNLLIADVGAGNVYRVLANAAVYPTSTISALLATTPASANTVATGIHPTHIAADTAGNTYVQDATTQAVTEYPLSGASATVYSTLSAPQGVSVSGNGVVYGAEAGRTTLDMVARNNLAYTFPTTSATLPIVLTNTGNFPSTGYASTDSAEFPLTTGSTNGCGTIPSTANVLQVGAGCTTTASFTPGNNGNLVFSATTLLPAASSVGVFTLSGQEPTGTTYTTTTKVSGPTTAVYVASGTEITFSVAESSSNSNSQTGESVNVTIDSGSATPYTIGSGGTVSVPVSGLTAGSHSITAAYPGDGTYLNSTGSASFSITQAATTVTWNPSATTVQYSAALGTAILNATATAPGSFIYTATPSGGSASYIHSASYLPILASGTYTLGVTFVPTDAVDFAQSTATVNNFTVTKASTTAAVGVTQNLVASDGTGNYTSVQAAVNALPSGGSVYIKPGTYTGDITVVQPNVALRGLGGDPTKVILTHAGGAFGGSGVYAYAGEFTVAMENGYQLPSGSSQFTGDEGSATLVVAKGINTALSTATTIPNSFYGENFSLINSYDSDAVTTTSTYLPAANSGTCTANEGPAQTYSYLYNNSLLCASQALAIWTTSDLSIMNNVYTTSLQDTIYAASQGSGSSGYVPARQYWFRGKVTGDVDYIFGDAAAVFDSTSVYSAWHGTAATGTDTIHAQNKAVQTGSTNDYLSGYVMNSNVFTSQSTGMTSLYFGRPYGTYSTWIMLNSYIDQVNATGYTTGLGPALGPTTFGEFNDLVYTDPATNGLDLNGIPYLGTGGNTGTGVTGTRENLSTNPGTPQANDNPPTTMTQAQAQAYFPTNFLSQTVSSAVSTTQNWNPTAALAANVNSFVPAGNSATVTGGSPVTVLIRPQTPGLGAITSTTGANTVFTVPTGTYTLSDTFNGATTVIASGSLDASGEAYVTSNNITAGSHSLSWTYSGDSNFSGSTTSTPLAVTVSGASTTTALAASVNPIVYGNAASITATVSASAGTPTGSVTLTIDGTTTQTAALSSGATTFTVQGLTAGTHSFSASYTGSPSFVPSATSSNYSLTVSQATLTVTPSCTNRVFGAVNTCTANVSGYRYSDTAATVFTGTPSGSTTAVRNSPAGSYPVTATGLTLTSFGSTNYTVSAPSGTFNVTGGASQSIIFPSLPNFPHGSSYQLTARTTSGLGVTYTVTTGSASISGSTLTVSGAGLVTIQASSATDATGDYAAATQVSRSFTAQ